MTQQYNNVYLNETGTIVGHYEQTGPIASYFDKIEDKDFYFGQKSFEKAEVYLLKESIDILLSKCKLKETNIDLLISGDLQNQIATSSYMSRNYSIPFLGVYNACASSAEGIIIGASFIEQKKANNCICSVSSHNMVAEKQFRNPTEYGSLKPKISTFTVTGGASVLLSNKKSKVKLESSTIGRTMDYDIKDVNNMGGIMAIAAADTLYRHLTALKRNVNYYDLILTGDLGYYGKQILIEYMKKEYQIDLEHNYNDCGTMIYDINKQNVFAGGSGPACSALVTYSFVYDQLKKKNINKVLIIPTGAIFSQTMTYQKESIPSIAHAISLEAV